MAGATPAIALDVLQQARWCPWERLTEPRQLARWNHLMIGWLCWVVSVNDRDVVGHHALAWVFSTKDGILRAWTVRCQSACLFYGADFLRSTVILNEKELYSRSLASLGMARSSMFPIGTRKLCRAAIHLTPSLVESIGDPSKRSRIGGAPAPLRLSL